MAAMGAYLQNIIAQFVTGHAAPAAPTSLMVGLSCGDPGADGSTLVEPQGNYARQASSFSQAANPGGGTKLTSTTAIVFGPATISAWQAATHGILFDVSGNILAYGPLGVQRAPPVGDTISFGPGAIQFVIR